LSTNSRVSSVVTSTGVDQPRSESAPPRPDLEHRRPALGAERLDDAGDGAGVDQEVLAQCLAARHRSFLVVRELDARML